MSGIHRRCQRVDREGVKEPGAYLGVRLLQSLIASQRSVTADHIANHSLGRKNGTCYPGDLDSPALGCDLALCHAELLVDDQDQLAFFLGLG